MLIIEQRLKGIEKSNNNWFRYSLVSLCLIVGSIIFAFKPQVAEVVQARSIELLNPMGDKLVKVNSDQSGGNIDINSSFEGNNNIVNIKQTTTNGGSLNLNNDLNKSVFVLSGTQDGGSMRITDKIGNLVTIFGSSNLNTGSIYLFDKQNTILWTGPPQYVETPPIKEVNPDAKSSATKKGKTTKKSKKRK